MRFAGTLKKSRTDIPALPFGGVLGTTLLTPEVLTSVAMVFGPPVGEMMRSCDEKLFRLKTPLMARTSSPMPQVDLL
jgi:hypothetical protein